MSNLLVFASHIMWLYFTCLYTQYIFCNHLILGFLDLFNTSMGLELTSTFMTMVKALDSYLSTFFQSILKYIEKPTA